MPNARIAVPANAKHGEVVEIRIAIQHPMETGFRFDMNGRALPKNVINQVACRYNGVEVFRAELGSGIAANPYLEFQIVADRSGKLEFDWIDDAGVRGSEAATIAVSE